MDPPNYIKKPPQKAAHHTKTNRKIWRVELIGAVVFIIGLLYQRDGKKTSIRRMAYRREIRNT
jgi:hypothetical protein